MDSSNQPTLTPDPQAAVPSPEHAVVPDAASPANGSVSPPKPVQRRVITANFGGDLTSSLQSLAGTIV
ncbi:MAG TPA: hypothetical protein VGS41_16405, partial [Chthonomonadales bacterium]|nr:hypothetical protein [Chthonomonadales bacterium]